MASLLGIDLGTTGLKATIFDSSGTRQGMGYQRCRELEPSTGIAEQDPDQWWKACQLAIQEALTKSGLDPRSIAGVGIGGFHHCPVFLDADGRPVRPTIVPQDRRLYDSWQELNRSGTIEEMTAATGSMISHYHFPPIFHWVRKHDSKAFNRTRHILLAKDYLRLKLTGILATEICDATGTSLIKMPERTWSSDLCELAKVPQEMLPSIGVSHEISGVVKNDASKATGLLPGTPVVYGGGDTHCALLGLGIIRSQDIGLLLGTNGTLRASFQGMAKHPEHKVWVQEHIVPGFFTVSASTMAGASVLEWFKNNFCLDLSSNGEQIEYETIERAVGGVSPGSDGLTFNPYIFGERSPFLNPKACATFSGITHLHSRAHFLRSVMEGVACCLVNCLQLIQEVAASREDKLGMIRIGGGGSQMAIWCQIIADVLDKPVAIFEQSEVGCLGAAMLAGIGTNVFDSPDHAINKCVRVAHVLKPNKNIQSQCRELLDRFNRLKAVVEPEFFH